MVPTVRLAGPMADLPFGSAAAPPPPPLQLPPPPPVAAAGAGGAFSQGNGSAAPTSLREAVAFAQQNNHSDLHIGVGEIPRFRSRGEIFSSGWPVIDRERFSAWLRELLSPGQIDTFLRQKDYSAAHDFGFVRLRITLSESLRGPAMALRLIPPQIPSLQDLALPPVLAQLARSRRGLVLVSGAHGSGKSTTLAAIIDHINRTMSRHILTVEDPIEFVHQSDLSLVRQRQVPRHTPLHAAALRLALREDSDVLVIDAIDDQAGLNCAFEAVQAGLLVFASLPAGSAVHTLECLLSLYGPDQQQQIRHALSEALLAVLCQGLVKSTDAGRCRFDDLFLPTQTSRDCIQRGALDELEEIMVRSNEDGMITSHQCLAALVESGRVAAEEAIAVSRRPAELAQQLRSRR